MCFHIRAKRSTTDWALTSMTESRTASPIEVHLAYSQLLSIGFNKAGVVTEDLNETEQWDAATTSGY